MINLSNPDHTLLMRANGRLFEVVAVCPDVDSANAFLEAEDRYMELGIIDQDRDTGTVFIARFEEFLTLDRRRSQWGE